MILTQGTDPATEVEEATWLQVRAALSRLHPDTFPYCILTDPRTGSYIQCAGGQHRLTVERRIMSGRASDHVVFGKQALTSGGVIGTTTIECAVGPILVKENEVLTTSDAIRLFEAFFSNQPMPAEYATRVVTELLM